MEKTQTVSVTRDHIKNGVRREAACCPIALALRDMFPGANVSVCKYAIEVSFGTYPYDRALPRAASKFIEDFDFGFKPNPFKFEIKAIPTNA